MTTTTETNSPPTGASTKRQTISEKLAGKSPPSPPPKDLRALAEDGNAEAIRKLAADAEPVNVATSGSAEPWVCYVNVNGKPERRIDWPKYCEAARVDLSTTRGMDAEEIRDTLPPPVVHGVLRRGSVMLLAGASKARKSWLALHLALAVRTGGKFVGFPTEAAAVRYLDFELKPLTGRARYSLARLGLTDDDEMQAMIDAGFHYHSFRGLPFEAGTIAGIAEMMKAEAKAGELWFLDCLQPVLEIDQNDAVAVRAELRPLMEAATVTGAALVLIDHFNKSAEARGMARVSGSVAKVATVDSILTLTPKDELIHLDFDLREDPPIGAPLAVRFNSHTHGFDVVNPDEAKQATERAHREQLGEWLATGWSDGKEAKTRSDLAAAWGMTSTAGGLRQRIAALVAARMIREGKQGRSLIYEVATGANGNLRQLEATSPETLME